MNTVTAATSPIRLGSLSARTARLTALVLVLAGCDGLLDVENPTNLQDSDLSAPMLETALSGSAEGNLAGPYSTAVVYGELLGDQIFHPAMQDYGILIDTGFRRRDNVMVAQAYTTMASARWIADDMVTRLTEMVADPSRHQGVAASYYWGAIARLTMAMYFEEVTYDAGAPITPAKAIADAVERLTSAAQVAKAGGNSNLEAGAYGSLARAYRSLYYEKLHYGSGPDPALFQQAESFARQAISTKADFLVNIRYGQPGATNGIYGNLNVDFYHRMAPWYAGRKDPVSGQADPRIVVSGSETPGARGDPRFWQGKYKSLGDPLPVSRAAEAELIIAEARLLAGDLPGAVEWINRVRTKAGLPDFASSNATEIRTQLIYERDTELWLEGRRMEDHRFYEVLPARWADVNKSEGVHGRYPVSDQEKNNNSNYR